jgi:hypothetical protein
MNLALPLLLVLLYNEVLHFKDPFLHNISEHNINWHYRYSHLANSHAAMLVLLMARN